MNAVVLRPFTKELIRIEAPDPVERVGQTIVRPELFVFDRKPYWSGSFGEPRYAAKQAIPSPVQRLKRILLRPGDVIAAHQEKKSRLEAIHGWVLGRAENRRVLSLPRASVIAAEITAVPTFELIDIPDDIAALDAACLPWVAVASRMVHEAKEGSIAILSDDILGLVAAQFFQDRIASSDEAGVIFDLRLRPTSHPHSGTGRARVVSLSKLFSEPLSENDIHQAIAATRNGTRVSEMVVQEGSLIDLPAEGLFSHAWAGDRLFARFVAPSASPSVVVRSADRSKSTGVGVGLIGAGRFAESRILPVLKKTDARLRGVASASGVSARILMDRYGFAFCSGDYKPVIADPETRAVFVSTRNDTHVEIACAALKAGHYVYLEKPMAIHEAGLTILCATAAEFPGRLMTGFNRRATPALQEIRNAFAHKLHPVLMHYTVNGGYRPGTAWVYDRAIGGGRVLSDLCHFVDALNFVSGRTPVSVTAFDAAMQTPSLNDHMIVNIVYDNASVGTISYSAYGDSSGVQERLEVIGGGQIAVHTDFDHLTFSGGGRTHHELLAKGPGHAASFQSFLASASKNLDVPIPLSDQAVTMKTCFAILRSLELRASVPIDPA